MTSRPSGFPAPSQLQHLFALGLRFDTELEYLVAGAKAQADATPGRDAPRAYRRLLVRQADFAQVAALTSVVQCVSVVGQRSLRGVPKFLEDHDLGSQTQGPACLEASNIQRLAAALAPKLVTEAVTDRDAANLGIAALHSLASGHMAMLGMDVLDPLRETGHRRWATVTGVETAQRGLQVSPVRGLLLLDSVASEPWACGHNARLELGGPDSLLQERSQRPPQPEPGLTYRYLTGERLAVRLIGLVVFKRP